jgi:hypothetical protein
LDKDPVDGRVIVELGDALEKLGFGDIFGIVLDLTIDVCLLLLAYADDSEADG